MGRAGGVVGPAGEDFGVSRCFRDCAGRVHGRYWQAPGVLGGSWALPRPPGGLLGRSWAHLGGFLGPLGALGRALEASWASWRPLGLLMASWGPVGGGERLDIKHHFGEL